MLTKLRSGARRGWRALLLVVQVIAAGEVARADDPEIKPLLNFGWRQEVHDTLSNDEARDSSYSFGNLRARFGLDIDWERVSIHVLGQAAGAYSLPANASFGIGGIYFSASGGEDRAPGHVGLAELNVRWRPSDRASIVGGRLGIQDGAEVFTGEARFDALKRTRLAERLIGTWDWVNVGRRFDGGTVAIDGDSWHGFGFVTRVLQGGVDYDNAFEHLNGVDTAGFTLTSKKGAWIPSSEVRLFDIFYKDSRSSTESLLGDRLLVNAVGASLMGIYPRGPGAWDLMLWFAYEFGDFGNEKHRAGALVAEGGYGWPQAWGSPWLRGGIAVASGDSDPSDGVHETFFNMAPTNHKWYGLVDLNAFQNLTNLYGQFQVKPHRDVGLTFDAHLFRLTDTADAWYGGSGPANNEGFGYVARRPPDGTALPSGIGTEMDLVASWTPHPRAALQVGLSRFAGGQAAKELFSVEDDFTWFYVQVILRY